ncbi:hypothetical protein CesoFtcFv8_007201 [Champsocephalus esox]|uniref:Uncharacterized protein n=2 Tax=Champsocephalus TaxID=52236 RepID=A0AAN8HU62_CHAGU|nr:hypothetical protein CesoFtcFv8_007201 [Champsocephalus esox]KAK5927667.1 hypothetical protein CgunFtcFv8_012800 [Champsocephalus gunnari]
MPTHTQDDNKVLSWESHTPGPLQELRAIWSPQASAAPSSSQASSDLALHSYSCVWSRLYDGNDDTVIPVGGWFFQGYSSPTPPWTDLREMPSGPAARYSSLVLKR